MKTKVLLMGTMAGAIVQKYIGFGNVLRNVGIPYPTITISPAPSPVPEILAEHRGNEPIIDETNQVDKVSENQLAGFGSSMPFAFARQNGLNFLRLLI